MKSELIGYITGLININIRIEELEATINKQMNQNIKIADVRDRYHVDNNRLADINVGLKLKIAELEATNNKFISANNVICERNRKLNIKIEAIILENRQLRQAKNEL
jgi:hypothetical protein